MRWRAVFFAINFGAAVLFVLMCAVAVGYASVDEPAPFAFIGGACFLPPTVVFGLGEWLLYMRGARKLEQPHGFACGMIGEFAIWGLVANAAEAVKAGGSVDPQFWFVFSSVCVGIAAYAFLCCWLRVRRRTFTEDRGFPVEVMFANAPTKAQAANEAGGDP